MFFNNRVKIAQFHQKKAIFALVKRADNNRFTDLSRISQYIRNTIQYA